jgi:hypothetical protein
VLDQRPWSGISTSAQQCQEDSGSKRDGLIGIGVGLGVPFMLALSFWLNEFLKRRDLEVRLSKQIATQDQKAAKFQAHEMTVLGIGELSPDHEMAVSGTGELPPDHEMTVSGIGELPPDHLRYEAE